MSETYLKCSCRSCGGRIEFPAHAVGLSIGCPHCGATTDLYASPASTPAPPPLPLPQVAAPPPRPASSLVPQPPPTFSSAPRLQVATPPPPPAPTEEELAEQYASVTSTARPINWIGWTLAALSVLLVLVGGLMYFNNAKQGNSVFPSRQTKRTVASARPTPQTAAQEETETTTESPKSTAQAAPAKSIDDFKVSKITLQKSPGNSLVYAIGTVRNDSDLQRFGVRIELDLLDAGGRKIGSTKDYVKVVDPHREWRFRALVLARGTASVKLAKISEDE